MEPVVIILSGCWLAAGVVGCALTMLAVNRWWRGMLRDPRNWFVMAVLVLMGPTSFVNALIEWLRPRERWWPK